VTDILTIARSLGLEKVEAEFIGEQEAAIKMFACSVSAIWSGWRIT